MSQLVFYERPVALNRERHRKLRVAPRENMFRFAAATNSLPIVWSELAEAARAYPVVFAGEEKGPLSMAVLVGMRDRENLLVDAEGHWTAGRYIPAFARRYPFVLAATGEKEPLTVCVDESWDGLTEAEGEGEALFDAEGKETEFLQRILEFLRMFHNEALATAAFADKLRSLGLLVPRAIKVEQPGQAEISLRGMWIVDEARYRAIDDARVVELFRAGHSAWIEAHLMSLGNLGSLVTLMQARDGAGRAADTAAPRAAADAPAPAGSEAGPAVNGAAGAPAAVGG